MPKPGYVSRLTDHQVIKLFDSGRYVADLKKGVLLSGKTNKPLYVYTGGRYSGLENGYLWVRLYRAPAMRAVTVARVIWIVGNRSIVPVGFEIHHRDFDILNNRFNNLYALHPNDHRKLHKKDLIDEDCEDIAVAGVPF